MDLIDIVKYLPISSKLNILTMCCDVFSKCDICPIKQVYKNCNELEWENFNDMDIDTIINIFMKSDLLCKLINGYLENNNSL